MSDEIRTQKSGRRRRNVRRLTRSVIALPASSGQPSDARSSLASDAPPSFEDLDALQPPVSLGAPAYAASLAPGTAVASSLAELRLPDGSAAFDSEGAASSSDTESLATDADSPQELTQPSAGELTENPDHSAAPAEQGTTAPLQRGPDVDGDSAPSSPEGASTGQPADAAASGSAPADGSALDSASAEPVTGEIEPIEDEPETNPQIQLGDLAQLRASADQPDAAAFAPGRGQSPLPPPLGSDRPKRIPRELQSRPPKAAGGGARVPRVPRIPTERPRADSDAPTRPRIELSDEMALAAGRVTSLDMPAVSDDPYAPGRGSKVPPPGEPRMISSLTGRRSSAPRPLEEEETDLPSVVVTRSKFISDRPPRPRGEPVEGLAAIAATVPPGANSAPPDPGSGRSVPPVRASRRPGALDGEEFETLDLEEGEVESQRPQGTLDDGDADSLPSKAPPPPPQYKRAGQPPAAAPAPPKAAPPPPPRAVHAPAPIASVANPGHTPSAGGAAGSASYAVAPPVAAAATSRKHTGRGTGPRRRQWWETLFSDEYLRTVVRPSSAQIARQVDFMQASLGVTKGTAVLDVGCGLGQHALEFARRGCLVVALDLALPMITRAAEDAQQEGLRINFLHKDIRDIGFEGTFDAVLCVGTTFGFFDDEQNREVLGRLANALKPGGRLLLDVVNRDHVLSSQPNLQWFEGDGCVVMEESDFNYYSSRLTVKRTMMREDGRQTESEYSIRLYALHELGQMMQQAGFRVKEVSGQQATRGVFFGAESNRIILLAERRAPSPARANGHSSDSPPEQ